MDLATAMTVGNLDDARILRDLVEKVKADHGQDVEQDDDETDTLVLILLDSLILDNEFQLGFIPSPYTDNLHRRIILKQIMRTADRILDALAEAFDGEPLPPSAAGLCRFIFAETLPLVKIIEAIEAEHPEQAETFAWERAQYASSRAGVAEAEHEIH